MLCPAGSVAPWAGCKIHSSLCRAPRLWPQPWSASPGVSPSRQSSSRTANSFVVGGVEPELMEAAASGCAAGGTQQSSGCAAEGRRNNRPATACAEGRHSSGPSPRPAALLKTRQRPTPPSLASPVPAGLKHPTPVRRVRAGYPTVVSSVYTIQPHRPCVDRAVRARRGGRWLGSSGGRSPGH